VLRVDKVRDCQAMRRRLSDGGGLRGTTNRGTTNQLLVRANGKVTPQRQALINPCQPARGTIRKPQIDLGSWRGRHHKSRGSDSDHAVGRYSVEVTSPVVFLDLQRAPGCRRPIRPPRFKGRQRRGHGEQAVRAEATAMLVFAVETVAAECYAGRG